MNKRIKILLKSLKEVYSTQIIEKAALKTKFMKRKSKITPEIFSNSFVYLKKPLELLD